MAALSSLFFKIFGKWTLMKLFATTVYVTLLWIKTMVLVLLSYHKVVNLSVALSICPAYNNSLYLLGTQNISKLTIFKIINDFFLDFGQILEN